MACPMCGCKEVYQYDDGWDAGGSGDERAMRCAACGEIFDIEDGADEDDDEPVTAGVGASVRPQPDESKMPPRPTGSNDANTDPDSPLKRYGRASKESGLLLEPMADGYWTPWHIANEMLREAQRVAGAPEVLPPSSALREAAYDQIDRYLRNNLDDADYADYSQALDLIYTTVPTAGVKGGMTMDAPEEMPAGACANYDYGDDVRGATQITVHRE